MWSKFEAHLGESFILKPTELHRAELRVLAVSVVQEDRRRFDEQTETEKFVTADLTVL